MQTTTLLPLSPDRTFALFQEEARHYDLPSENLGNALKVISPFGEILVSDTREGVRVTVNAPDRAKLYVLQETIDHILGEIGAADGLRWSETIAGSRPANMTVATVERCERLSPSYFRVRLSDPDLARFSRDGLHFRLLFGPSDRPEEWPTIAETGRTEWPGGAAAWHRPVYTARFVDPAAGTLDFDVFVHRGGRISQWCETVEDGAQVALMGPGGDWLPRARWLGLVGDETALPAIARILEAAPSGTTGEAVIMANHEDDVQTLVHPDGVSVRWLLRSGGETLPDALAALKIPTEDRLVWFAGEKSEVAAARKQFAAVALKKGECQAAAYWAR